VLLGQQQNRSVERFTVGPIISFKIDHELIFATFSPHLQGHILLQHRSHAFVHLHVVAPLILTPWFLLPPLFACQSAPYLQQHSAFDVTKVAFAELVDLTTNLGSLGGMFANDWWHFDNC
jgi:hypothetical protein